MVAGKGRSGLLSTVAVSARKLNQSGLLHHSYGQLDPGAIRANLDVIVEGTLTSFSFLTPFPRSCSHLGRWLSIATLFTRHGSLSDAR